jgi:phenylacetate-CoA ligase
MSDSLIQRAALAVSLLNPAFARVNRWMLDVWRADEEGYGRLIAERLNSHAESFARRGLFEPPAAELYPAHSLEALARWPVFERVRLQGMYARLRELYADDPRYIHYQSGGSTGEPTQLYRLKTTSPLERLSSIHMLRVVGWSPGTLRICLWGSDRDLGLKLDARRGLKAWLAGQLTHVIAIGGYAPDDATYLEFVDCVHRHPGCAVYGYTGLLDECARLMLRRGETIEPGVISAFWGTAEMLHPHQRELFEEAYGAPVRDFYGSRECPYMAAECSHGTRHINPRYYMEVVDSGRNTLAPGEQGELCVTDLFNDATPLIRYMIGDMGAVCWQRCGCGRNGLALVSLAGRVNDVIRLKSGRYLSSVFFPQVVKQYPGIRKAQLARLGTEHFAARYTGELTGEIRREMQEVISSICEGARVNVELVDEIPLTREGKLRYYVDESGD